MEFLLYAPTRPIVDYSVIFLWAMAVGTIVTASLWQEFGSSEHIDERYNELSKVYHILFSVMFMKFIVVFYILMCLTDFFDTCYSE